MRKLNGQFEGWIVNQPEGILIDADGNSYDKDEIRALFYFRQWKNDFEGANGRISSLKEHLERKIENTKLPEVTIDWGDIQERYIHPHYRK